ncbi:ap-2 complex subunit mu-1 [Curvularia clavata]|uniref:Ap-2 complex subunit mu-1 n=1 Tax=Curvularia clavata TaxID=95742 RepID=A0A9Q8ZAI6_CURCL|nr:ap-2 complex subunit mu-1 [Curvularia clavata]
MLSGILIFNQKGENLIFRAFRNDCRPRLADVFRIQVISNAQVRSPILTLGSTTFSHVKHENIYLVAVTKTNANAALVFEFLYRLVGLGKAYFGKFDEEAVKNNFVLVYELLDEILDFGYPQNTETDTLKMYITTEGVKSERTMEDSSKITMQATGALSWRRADIKYRKNEAFVDVIEDVNLLMSATGTVLRADVNGQIIMRAYLSGTPECKFGLNDRLTLGEDHLQQPSGNKAGAKATRAAAGSVTLEDCQFHQCVKLGKFDSDRIISFIPPDGEFELMRYRATENVNLPFKVHAIVNEIGKTKVEYSIAIRANYGSKLFATNVVVRIPTPLNTARITERTSQGKAKYEPEHNNIVWKIPRFTGQSEFVLSAEASLTSMTNQKAWSRPPLNLSFSLLMFTSSGLLVRYLKVFEKSNYSSVKWVRYMTRAGNYEISTVTSSRRPPTASVQTPSYSMLGDTKMHAYRARLFLLTVPQLLCNPPLITIHMLMSAGFLTLKLSLGKFRSKAQQLAVLRRQLIVKPFLRHLRILVFGLEIVLFSFQVAEACFQGSDFGLGLANLGVVILQLGFVCLAFCVCFPAKRDMERLTSGLFKPLSSETGFGVIGAIFTLLASWWTAKGCRDLGPLDGERAVEVG